MWETLFAGYRLDTATDLNLVRNRTINSLLGLWLQCDPIDFQAGDTRYAYASGNPYRFIDAFGNIAFDIDVSTCTITLTVKVQLNFEDRKALVNVTSPWGGVHTKLKVVDAWTQKRKDAFQADFKSHIESAFNGTSFGLFPAKRSIRVWNPARGIATTGISCETNIPCPCADQGLTPRLNIVFGSFRDDFTVTVMANAGKSYVKSSANTKHGTSEMDEGDFTPVDKPCLGQTFAQEGGVHEFGHLMGNQHPSPGAFGRGQYEGDCGGLMGAGMEMRSQYFNKWADVLNSSPNTGSCGPWTAR